MRDYCRTTDRGRSARRLAIALAATLTTITVSTAALAQDGAHDYPDRPISFIVQFGAGGTTDLSARKLVSLAEKVLGQPIVVRNVTGATGNLGHNTIAKAAPDGYTIGAFAYSGTVLIPHIQPVPFDTRTDFSFIAQYADLPQLLVVGENSPWRSVGELIDWAKSKPGEFTYGTTGTGSAQHLFMELLSKNEKIKTTHVPYRGGLASAMAVVGGEIKGSLSAESAGLALSERVRPLAVLGEQRLAALPEVPTFNELGYRIPMPLWVGVVGPKGLPDPIRKKLENAFSVAFNDPSYKPYLEKMMLTPRFLPGEAFQRTVLKDYERGREIVEAIGLDKLNK